MWKQKSGAGCGEHEVRFYKQRSELLQQRSFLLQAALSACILNDISSRKEDRQMIKGCIFDLDGTLADTLESIAAGVNAALQEEGFVPRPVEDFNYYAGDGFALTVQRAYRDCGGCDEEQQEKIRKRAAELFAMRPFYHIKPYEGMVEALAELKKRNIRLAVLSNKAHVQAVQVVEKLFGSDCFDVIQGLTEGIKRKPDPSGAFAIADFWNCSPKECLYVGDTDTDMKTGKAAGMKTIGVAWGFRTAEELWETGADQVICHPSGLLDQLTEKE